MANLAQRSFAAGEIAPALYARTDQTKYATGLRTCRNFLVQRHGGVANRPGTEFITSTKNDGAVRLIRFAYSASVQYVLEFGDRYLRVYQAGGQLTAPGSPAWVTATAYAVGDLVTQGGVTYYCTAAHTSGATTQPGVGATWASNWYALTGVIYEIPTPYLAADLAGLQTVQSGNIVTIVHPSYAPRTLTRYGATKWILTTNAFTPTIGAATGIAATGGGAGGTTYWAITAVDASGQEGLPAFYSVGAKVPSSGTPTTLTWNPVAGAIGYNVYRSTDGRSYGLVGPAGGTPSPVTDNTYTTTTSTAGPITALAGVWYPAGNQVRNQVTAALADKSYDGSYSFASSMTITAVGGGSAATTRGRVHAYYSRDGEPRVDAGTFEGSSIFGFTSSTQPISGTIFVPDNGYTALVIDLVAEVMPGDSANTVSCALDSSASVMSWSIIGGGTVDVGGAVDYESAPPTKQTLFQATGDYPSAVGYYQQRRIFANTVSHPERVWASRTGIYDSFTTSTPLQDDDALSFEVASREVNAVKHVLDVGRLLIFTESGMTVVGESVDDILSPSSIDPRKRLYYGATALKPLVLGNAVLFVQAPGSIVRDVTADFGEGYKTSELSLFAAHLVDGYSIVDWDLAATPHSIVWAVRDDGVLLGLTYLREQELAGWHRHDTDGFVENVCVVREGLEDRLYLVVRRTINGATKRYVERLASRVITDRTDRRSLIFSDASLAYDGRNLDPLKTITLSGSSDWSTEAPLTVTAAGATPFATIGVGDAIVLYDAAGVELLRINITAVTSGSVATGYPSKLVPVALRNVATAAWASAADTLSGLGHLEGKAVAIWGDGAVVASPNNSEFLDPIVVTGGSVTLPKPVAVAHVGLPYLCDLETLDIDSPQGPSVKDKKMSISAAILELERSLSCFVGAHVPTGADPLEHMDELKLRDATDEYDPIELRTGDADITIAREWDSNGRLAVRVVDPVPVTVLAIIPRGSLPSGG